MADDVLNSLLSGELNHMQVIDALSSSSSIVVRDTMFTWYIFNVFFLY